MVRKYIKKGTRKSYTTEALKLAIEAVVKRGASIRQASLENGIPHATLSRKIHLLRLAPEKGIDSIASQENNLKKTLFSKEQEIDLCRYIYTMQSQSNSYSGVDIRALAYLFAEKWKLPHRFNKENKLAGEDWLRGFLKRHPDVIVKKRTTCFSKTPTSDKENIDELISTLESIIDDYQLEASDLFTLDETTIPCVENLDLKSETESSQNKLVTAEMCFSASGVYLPLMLIFPSNDKSLIKGAPAGSIIEFDPLGQMQVNLFLKWLKMFVRFSKASKDTPKILIVNKYQYFLKNFEVLELIDKNGVYILNIPSDASNKLHPMYYSLMKNLKENYLAQVLDKSKNFQHQSIEMNEVGKLFGKAFKSVATIVTAVESFQNTGIWPLDRNKIEQNSDLISAMENIPATENYLLTCTETESSENLSNEDFDEKSDLIFEEDEPLKKDDKIHEPQIIIIPSAASIENLKNQNLNQLSNTEAYESKNFYNEKYFNQTCLDKKIQEMEYQIVEGDLTSSNLKVDSIQSSETDNQLHDLELSSVIIPPEAQLSEIKINDLQTLVQGEKKLYFYVSPLKLNLLRK